MGGVEDRWLLTQCRSCRPAGDLRKVLLGRQSGPSSEQAIEMKLRQADMSGDLRQFRLALEFALDKFNRARHAHEVAAVDEAVRVRGYFHIHCRILQMRPGGFDPIFAVMDHSSAPNIRSSCAGS